MKISELKIYSQEAYEQLCALMQQLTDEYVLTEEALRAVIDDPNAHLYVVRSEKASSEKASSEKREVIIGCATLCVFHSPTGKKATVEDVVVSADYRGQHLGEQLMNHLLTEARQMAPIELHLTSRPKRVAANLLYQKLGFRQKETNVYVKSEKASSEK